MSKHPAASVQDRLSTPKVFYRRSWLGAVLSGVVLAPSLLLLPLSHEEKARAGASQAGDEGDGVQAVSDVLVNSPKEAVRTKLFATTLDQPSCLPLAIDPRGKVDEIDGDLSQFLQTLLAAIQQKKELALQPLFHRRLNVALPAIAEALAKQDITLGAPFEVSIHRLLAFNTVDGSPSKLRCDKDALGAFPLYGYPLQFGAWLSVLGKNELGRIYVGIVPADGRWNIGSFHSQQWTHAGRDAASWADEGMRAAKAQQNVAAFTMFDIAAKLSDGGGFLELDALPLLEQARDAQMSRDERDKTVRDGLKPHDIVHVATLLVPDGAGLLVRVRVAGEISLDEIKQRCLEISREMKEKPWSTGLVGARCSFLMPKEAPTKDGGLGGVYVSFNEIKK